MKRWIGLAGAAALSATLAACGGKADREAALRLIHAAPDAPFVNLQIDGVAVRSGIDYRRGTTLLPLARGGYEIGIEGLVPGGTLALPAPGPLTTVGDTDYSVILIGRIADASADYLLLEDSRRIPPAGKARLRLVHAAPDAPAVDIYLTAADTDLLASTPLATLAYAGASDPLEIDAGSWQLRITPAGEPGSVIFDAGTLGFAENSRLLIVAVENTGAGPAPVSLVVNTGTTHLDLVDRNTPAALRAIHLSPDAGPVDVQVQPATDEAAPVTALASGLDFPQSGGYRELAPTQYRLQVRPAGEPEAEPLLNFLQSVQPGQFHSVLVTGLLEQLFQQSLVDVGRAVATEARLRLVHSSPAAGIADLYLQPADAELDASVLVFRSVSLRVETGYRALAPGDYLLVVTAAGDSTVRKLEVPVTLAGGDVRTLFVRDSAGGGEPLALTAIDDLLDF